MYEKAGSFFAFGCVSTEIRHSELGWTFFRSSLLGVDINRAWNMPVGGFIQELKSLKEEVNKINEVSWRQRNLEFAIRMLS